MVSLNGMNGEGNLRWSINSGHSMIRLLIYSLIPKTALVVLSNIIELEKSINRVRLNIGCAFGFSLVLRQFPIRV